ncbi:hypothetical protein KNP414_05550 [Paenibacillus mucilaginosus KNP414]|uniref:Uncharacterized protein n=1 Tax=Paenibacillus mucilaginosus (strain KNP414) TaxID=1036673 RepID=F8FK33_PAEMK|nr:hypothetical protein KNP414_05550 [Paenibacillus mucilaginosus KNP414]
MNAQVCLPDCTIWVQFVSGTKMCSPAKNASAGVGSGSLGERAAAISKAQAPAG